MLTNKAQIARESFKTTLELPGPLSGPWTPAALVMFMLVHNLLRLPPPPPQMKIMDPPLIIHYFGSSAYGYSPIDRGSDRPIIEKGPIDRGSFRPRV